MQVTEIRKNKSNEGYSVFLDGKYAFSLDGETIIQRSIQNGTVLEERQVYALRKQSRDRKARNRAYAILGQRDHSVSELKAKLKKTVDGEAAEEICDRLSEMGYLDDEWFAREFLSQLLYRKRVGIKAARYELTQKGISPDMVEQLVSEMLAGGYDEQQEILHLLEKKYSGYRDDPKLRQRAISALLRKGFEYDNIRSVIKDNDEYYE